MSDKDFIYKRVWGPTPRYPLVKAAKSRAGGPIIIAGPCYAEPGIIKRTAQFLANQCITYMRGGVYRAGTYPSDKFGLDMEALKEFSRYAHKTGLQIILEVLDIRLFDTLIKFADALQIGARHMQDYALLKELKEFNGVVTIKRGVGQTLDEFLGAVEYLMGGRCQPVLIERGSSTYHNHVRWDLSVSIIPAIKKITGLPVIIDASHGTGRRDLVAAMTYAGVSAGADGWLVECHPDPVNSLSDSEQAVDFKTFAKINKGAKELYTWGKKQGD